MFNANPEVFYASYKIVDFQFDFSLRFVLLISKFA